MKIFLTYRFTGEDPQELEITLGKITSTLRNGGHEVYCSIEDEAWFQEKKHTNSEILKHTLSKIDESDMLLAFVKVMKRAKECLLRLDMPLEQENHLLLL